VLRERAILSELKEKVGLTWRIKTHIEERRQRSGPDNAAFGLFGAELELAYE